jgi:hypothetical protein
VEVRSIEAFAESRKTSSILTKASLRRVAGALITPCRTTAADVVADPVSFRVSVVIANKGTDFGELRTHSVSSSYVVAQET